MGGRVVAILDVTDYRPESWNAGRACECCEALEAGDVVMLRQVPYDFGPEVQSRLLEKRQSGLRFHKNISYRPATDELRGFASEDGDGRDELHAIMRQYSREVCRFVDRMLAPYAGKYQLDYASYRPIEEEGRPNSLHKRNDLLHVDAFPSRPTAGARILRVFLNVNPSRRREWLTGEDFGLLAERYAEAAGLGRIARRAGSIPYRAWRLISKTIGVTKGDRTAYDTFMLRFHDWLKENEAYQNGSAKMATGFPPGAVWMVYTDSVPHAVISGQFALEQTFIVPVSAMVRPEKAPIRILEKLAGRKLAA